MCALEFSILHSYLEHKESNIESIAYEDDHAGARILHNFIDPFTTGADTPILLMGQAVISAIGQKRKISFLNVIVKNRQVSLLLS